VTRNLVLRRLLLLLAGLGLLFGLGAGLVRLGITPGLPVPAPGLHGALMVSGFLGTLISLERAAALDRTAGYLVPAVAAVGALTLAAGAPYPVPHLFTLATSAGLLGVYFYVLRRHHDPGLAVTAAWVALWAGGNLVWLLTQLPWGSGSSSPGWPPGRLLWLVTALLAAGLLVGLATPEAGRRISGVALLGMSAWLFKYDIAWVTVRRPGQTRFIALCLIFGFFWLGLGGLWWVLSPYATAGPIVEGALHTVLLGFVMSMIFGHALIILPAVTGVALPFHPAFYAHLGLLHASLAAKIFGDAAGLATWREVGGTLNVAAIILFLLASAASAGFRRK